MKAFDVIKAQTKKLFGWKNFGNIFSLANEYSLRLSFVVLLIHGGSRYAQVLIKFSL
jgi:hypothetical protein